MKHQINYNVTNLQEFYTLVSELMSNGDKLVNENGVLCFYHDGLLITKFNTNNGEYKLYYKKN